MIPKKIKKPHFYILIVLASLIIIGGIFWHFGKKLGQKPDLSANVLSSFNNETANAPGENVEVLDEVNYNGEAIPLLWTDNNDNENLIIKTDRQYYDTSEQTEIFFSVANQSEKDQSADIYFWFDGKDKKVKSVEKIENGEISNSQLPILNEFSIPQFSNRKDVKGYTAGSKFEDTILVGQTNYYRAIINFPQGANGEFLIEAIGDNNAYGLLDPYYMIINTPLVGRGPQGGLVGYWTFDGADTNWTSATAGTTTDRSGYNNTGTMTSMSRTSSPTSGVSGQAFKFDGINDYVNVSPVSDNIATNDFSVSAWINFPPNYTLGSNCVIVFRSGDTLSNNDFFLDFGQGGTCPAFGKAGGLNFLVYTGSAWVAASSTQASWIANTWYHVAGTFSTTSGMTVYVNGVSVGTNSNKSRGATAATTTYIGAATTYAANYFPGVIDEARIYNRALTSSEITNLYQSGAARLKVNSQLSAPFGNSGLVGYWTFDGQDTNWTSSATGTTADKSGNNNTGTMTSMSRTDSPKSGISGQAFSFDKVDDSVNAGSASSLDDIELQGGGGMTVSAWIYPRSAGELGYGTIAEKGHYSGTGSGWLFNIETTSLRLEFLRDYATTDLSLVTNSSLIVLNTWQYVVATWDGSATASNIKIYRNGGLAGTLTSTNGAGNKMSDGANDLIIGNDSLKNTTFDGLIDEVRVYNRALSASEIANLYSLGLRRTKFKQ